MTKDEENVQIALGALKEYAVQFIFGARFCYNYGKLEMFVEVVPTAQQYVIPCCVLVRTQR